MPTGTKHHFRSIFLGSPGFAVPSLRALAEAGLTPSLVVSPPSRRRSRHGKPAPTEVGAAAAELGIPAFETENTSSPEAMARFSELAPDLAIVVAFGQILRKGFLNLPKHGCINLHPSLLPKYRGAAPINWAILDGETETGITVMRLVRKLDAGPILAQAPFSIPSHETADQALERAAIVGAAMIVDVARRFADGRPPEALPQDDSLATYAGMLSKEHGFIDFSRPAYRVWDQIRGVQPWPRATTRHLSGSGSSATITIWRAEPQKAHCAETRIGRIVSVSAEGIDVVCGQGSMLRLQELQIDGRRRLLARDFIKGYRIEAGDSLAPEGGEGA